MIRTILADDEPLIRSGIRSVLSTDPEIDVVGAATNGAEAVELVRRHRPAIALLDIQMPGMDGITATTEIRRLAPETGVVILTTFGDDGSITRALDAGAHGFVLKSGDPRELLQAVRAVTEGAAFLSPRVARRVITQLSASNAVRTKESADRASDLPPRDREILTLLGRGLSNADIARELKLTEGTVKVYVSALLAKIDATNRVQAAIFAFRAGLVS